MNFFIANAYADTMGSVPGAAQQGGGFPSMLLIMGLFVVFMYITIWRPQSKRAKEQQNMINSIGKDDEVITAGGVLGRVSKVSDQYITLSVATNLDLVLQKSAVVSVLPKGTIKSIV